MSGDDGLIGSSSIVSSQATITIGTATQRAIDFDLTLEAWRMLRNSTVAVATAGLLAFVAPSATVFDPDRYRAELGNTWSANLSLRRRRRITIAEARRLALDALHRAEGIRAEAIADEARRQLLFESWS